MPKFLIHGTSIEFSIERSAPIVGHNSAFWNFRQTIDFYTLESRIFFKKALPIFSMSATSGSYIFDSKIAQKGINCSSTAIGSSFCWSASCNVMSKLLWSDGRAFFKIFAQINFLIGVRRTWNRSLTIRNWDYAMRSDTMTALFLVIGRVKIYGTKIFIVSNKIIWFELNRSIVQINNWSKGFAYFLNIFNFFDSNTFFDINTTKNPRIFEKNSCNLLGFPSSLSPKSPQKLSLSVRRVSEIFPTRFCFSGWSGGIFGGFSVTGGFSSGDFCFSIDIFWKLFFLF